MQKKNITARVYIYKIMEPDEKKDGKEKKERKKERKKYPTAEEKLI